MVNNSGDINEGDLLFTVKAWGLNDDFLLQEEPDVIGEILQGDSEWTESLWGDERLFFSHSNISNDFREVRRKFPQSEPEN